MNENRVMKRLKYDAAPRNDYTALLSTGREVISLSTTMSGFPIVTRDSPRPVSAADSWTVLRENDENDALYGDLEGARRLIPFTPGGIKAAPAIDWECLEEAILLGLLVRGDIDRSCLEIQPDGRVRLVVVQNGSSRMRKCFMRNVRGQFYNCLGGAVELLDSWKGDRPLLICADSASQHLRRRT
ncbi:hypothetical protein Y032_0401g788 [Ancylostoma ceylanicum]|nr:hypothetical protein Y032_0401g788 [Ancylostoma ceylanicum]